MVCCTHCTRGTYNHTTPNNYTHITNLYKKSMPTVSQKGEIPWMNVVCMYGTIWFHEWKIYKTLKCLNGKTE